MSYSNVWSELTPLGSAAANTIDDHMRQIKLDVRERINSLIGASIGTALTDPVVPAGTDLTTLKTASTSQAASITTLNTLTGSQTLTQWFPWSAGFVEDPVISTSGGVVAKYATGGGLYYGGILDGSQPYISPIDIPIRLPVGVTITGVVGYAERPTATLANITLTLYSLSNLGARSSIASQAGSTGVTGTFNVSLGVLATTLLVDTGYYVRVSFTQQSVISDPRFFGLKVTYTSPDTTKRI